MLYVVTNGQGHERLQRSYQIDPTPTEGARPQLALLGWDHLHGGWRRLIGLDIPRHGRPAWPVLMTEHRCPDAEQDQHAADRPGFVPEADLLAPDGLQGDPVEALGILFAVAPPRRCRTCWGSLKSATVPEIARSMCKRCFNAGGPVFDPRTGQRAAWFCQATKRHRLRRTIMKTTDSSGRQIWACPECYRKMNNA